MIHQLLKEVSQLSLLDTCKIWQSNVQYTRTVQAAVAMQPHAYIDKVGVS